MNINFPALLINIKAAQKSEENVIFEADFNDDEIGKAPSGFNVLEDGGRVHVVALSDEADKSVYLEDTSEEKFVQLERKFEDLTGRIKVKMKFMQPSYT